MSSFSCMISVLIYKKNNKESNLEIIEKIIFTFYIFFLEKNNIF